MPRTLDPQALAIAASRARSAAAKNATVDNRLIDLRCMYAATGVSRAFSASRFPGTEPETGSRLESAGQAQRRSITVAFAMPPPSHIVCRP